VWGQDAIIRRARDNRPWWWAEAVKSDPKFYREAGFGPPFFFASGARRFSLARKQRPARHGVFAPSRQEKLLGPGVKGFHDESLQVLEANAFRASGSPNKGEAAAENDGPCGWQR